MDFSEKTPFPKDPFFRSRVLGAKWWKPFFKNLLTPLFLRKGCFPVDFQEVKRPLRTKSAKPPIKVRRQPIKEGKRPIKDVVLVGISVGCLMGCFRAPPPWRKTAPLKGPIKRSMILVSCLNRTSQNYYWQSCHSREFLSQITVTVIVLKLGWFHLMAITVTVLASAVTSSFSLFSNYHISNMTVSRFKVFQDIWYSNKENSLDFLGTYLALQACLSFCSVSIKSGASLFLPCSHKNAVAHMIHGDDPDDPNHPRFPKSRSIEMGGIWRCQWEAYRNTKDAAFLLTVGSFLLTVELFYLQLTILAFCLQL